MHSKYVGAVAGGTLGFIVANTRGAVAGARYGWRAGKKFSSMPLTPTHTPRKRRHTSSSSRSRSRSVSRGRPAVTRHIRFPSQSFSRSRSRSVSRSVSRPRAAAGSLVHGRSTDVPGSTAFKGSKHVAFKVPPKVKVTRAFKKKVEKVFEATVGTGRYQEIGISYLGTSIANQQTVGLLTSYQGNYPGSFFHPLDFMHAASVLWNQKAPSSTRTITDINNFDWLNLKLHVISSYVRFELKNNSQRTYYISVYEGAPKNVKFESGGTATSTGNLVQDWKDAVTIMSSSAGTSSLGNRPAVNVPNGVNSLHTGPTDYKAFTNWWKLVRKDLVLEPGQVYAFNCKGPSNMDLNYAKFWNGGQFMNRQKFERQFMYKFHTDLVGHPSDGRYGRFAAPASGYGLLCESKLVYNMEVPRMAGFNTTATGAGSLIPLPLNVGIPLDNAMGNVFNSFLYADSQTDNNILRIDDNNPLIAEQNAAVLPAVNTLFG